MPTPDRQRHGAIQDTGNPVLDTTINLLMNWPSNINFSLKQVAEVHETIQQLYLKEPIRPAASRPTAKSLAQMADTADAKRVH
jgi:hypothetical protein